MLFLGRIRIGGINHICDLWGITPEQLEKELGRLENLKMQIFLFSNNSYLFI